MTPLIADIDAVNACVYICPPPDLMPSIIADNAEDAADNTKLISLISVPEIATLVAANLTPD